jgi:hypothetical protein
MKDKEVMKPMTTEILENVEKIRRGFDMGSRIGVTQLGRSTQWRKDLENHAALEILDRNQTAGILLSPETFKSLLDYLDNVDQELEQVQVEKLYGNRKEMNWASGEDLATKAKASFTARQDHIRKFLDGDQ